MPSDWRALAFAVGVVLCAASATAAYPIIAMALWVPGVALCVGAWCSGRAR